MKFVRANISIDGSSVSAHLSFPKALLFLVNAFKKIVQFFMFILVVNVFAYWTYQYFTESAREQRNRLYQRLHSLNAEMDSIDKKMSELYHNEDLLYAKFGLIAPDTSIKEMGVGGQKVTDSNLIWSASSLKKLRATVNDRLDRTEVKIDRAHSSYLNLQFYMEQLHGNLQHTPSVWPSHGFLSSPFGYRTHPVTGETEKMHLGVDVSAQKWTSIRASANGRVDLVAESETMGRYVVIDHGNGIVTRYGHMVKPFAKEGQIVKRFDIIGYMGNTGRTTGNHLHYEVWVNGEAVNPVFYILPDQYSVE
jgi:murein DD-endopeptidase MepM/ murein hydrolase activator NlpD